MFSSSKLLLVRMAALLLGIASVILSFWMLGYFGVAFTHHLTIDPSFRAGLSWRVFVFAITRFETVMMMIAWIGAAGAAGLVGCWLVRRFPGPGRDTFGAMVGRLSMVGLLGVGLDSLLLAGLLGYRGYRLVAG